MRNLFKRQRKHSMDVSIIMPTLEYTLDLTKMHGEGEFPCPNCGREISPDHENGYKVTDTIMQGQNLLSIKIKCGCGAKITLTGFGEE